MDYSVEPIGHVSSPFDERAAAPRQGRLSEGVSATIELVDDSRFRDALLDVDLWDYLWVLFWFHLNDRWRPRVRPPRSAVKRGVFATRSPHRPNPIGLSVVRLDRVEGLTLHISEVDMLDGTPVLDLKPYLAWADSIPGAGEGWLGDRPDDPRPRWSLQWTVDASERADWLETNGVPLRMRVEDVLTQGPHPHAYRRIRDEGAEKVLSVKDWRVRFRVTGERAILVLTVQSGRRPREIFGSSDVRFELHRAFIATYS